MEASLTLAQLLRMKSLLRSNDDTGKESAVRLNLAIVLLILSAFMPNATAQDEIRAGSDGSERQNNVPNYFTLQTDLTEPAYPRILTPFLQGHAEQQPSNEDSPGRFLVGGIEGKASSITAVQHKRNARFHADLSALKPLYAPVSPRQLDAVLSRYRPVFFDLAAAKKKPLTADVSIAKPESEEELQRGKPQMDKYAPNKKTAQAETVPRKPSAPKDLSYPQPLHEVEVTPKNVPTEPQWQRQKPNADVPLFKERRPTTNEEPQPLAQSVPEVGHERPSASANTAVSSQPISVAATLVKPRTEADLIAPKRKRIDISSAPRPQVDVETLTEAPTDTNLRGKMRPSVDEPIPVGRRAKDEVLAVKPQDDATAIRRKRTQDDLAKARPEVDIQMRKSESVPELKAKPMREVISSKPVESPELDTTGRLVDRKKRELESKVSWDKWYADVSRLCEPLLADAVEKHGNPAGANSVKISVWRNHHLTASLAKGKDTDFNAAILEAYASLDGSSALEFPAGSSRDKVTFFVDNRHDTADPVSGVSSRSIVGDEEIELHK